MDRSNYLKTKWLKHVTGQEAYTMPSALYWTTFSVAPTDAGGGTENTSNGAGRKELSFATLTDETTAATDGPVEFTADGGSVTVRAEAIFDAPTGGNMLYHKTVTETTVADGQSYRNTMTSIAAG